MTAATAAAWELLASVPDPEVPVLSVVDLGIVRDVVETDDGRGVTVTLTPTYSGCPATEVIARDVRAALRARYDAVEVRTQLSPAWTTDWISDEAREKLRGFGIAPPSGSSAIGPPGTNVIDLGLEIGHRVSDLPEVDHVRERGLAGAGQDRPEACPQCGSADVEELAGFGSTPCKALWRCVICREPFDYFKVH